jgi:hypothetical protein
MSDPEVEATATLIMARCPGAALERTAMTVAQLCERAPLSLTWDDDTITPEGAARAPR